MDSTIKAITPEQRAELKVRFGGWKPISDFLPMVFPSGFRLTAFTVSCSLCNQDIESTHFRCDMVPLLPGVVRVDGIGVCVNCRLSINYLFRLRDESTFVIEKINESGQWSRYGTVPVSRIRRAQRAFLELLRSLWPN
ncbi:hypothetical protein ACYSUW_13350 [Pseudomonas frederiksbergensis]